MGVVCEVDGPWMLLCPRLPPAKAELCFKGAILPCLGTDSSGVATNINLLRSASAQWCWWEELLVQLGCIDLLGQQHSTNSTGSGSWGLTLCWTQSSALRGTVVCFWSLAPWQRFPFAAPTLAGSSGAGVSGVPDYWCPSASCWVDLQWYEMHCLHYLRRTGMVVLPVAVEVGFFLPVCLNLRSFSLFIISLLGGGLQ